MNSEVRPAWLVRQENGAIAEARTRAFLVDRFWVLERSADVEGADFIIQRRLTQASLLDRTPPRLGFVQVKFYASDATTQYVHREYVLDTEGKPRTEFFVICHTGMEDGIRSFLLSAEEISKIFPCMEEGHSKENRFALPGKDLLIRRFEIVDKRHALDRIERALVNADFVKNRAFVSWAMPSVTAAQSPPILPMYKEEINNWWGDIPSGFDDLQKKARRALWEFEDAVSQLQEICESQDPEKVAGIAETLQDDWGRSVSALRDLFDEDFLRAVRLHKKRYQQLTETGLIGTHAAIRRLIKERFVKDLSKVMPVPRNQVYLLKVTYEPVEWRDVHVTSRFEVAQSLWPEGCKDTWGKPTDMPDSKGVLEGKPGAVEVYIAPARYAYGEWVDGKYVEKDAPWEERLQWVADIAAETVLEQMLSDRFGEYSF